jgi:DNA polymerase III epsilon subunit-like protein
MQLPPLNFTVLDTETTGFIPKVNRVIEFASMQYNAGELVTEYETLIGIDGSIPKEVQTITRITDEAIAGKPSFDQVRAAIIESIGQNTIIVGQNIQFDIRMLKGEGIDLSDRIQLDTSMLASLVFPELESYSLPYMSEVLKLDHTPVHRALGDVRATMQLLSKCWERLQQITIEQYEQLEQMCSRSTGAYAALLAVLPKPMSVQKPQWWQIPGSQTYDFTENSRMNISTSSGLTLIEEPLDPSFIQTVVVQAIASGVPHCVAVKNTNITMKQLQAIDGVQYIEPPAHMAEPKQVAQFLAQAQYTDDEALLATKLLWYAPMYKDQIPLHGNEKDLWYSTLACTDESPLYIDQFTSPAPVKLLNHWQLLRSIDASRGDTTLLNVLSDHVLVFDNATLLEDTATSAFGYMADCHKIRAASASYPVLANAIDAVQIWIERVRGGQDVWYLSPDQLSQTDVTKLRLQFVECLEDADVQNNSSVRRMVEELIFILSPAGKHDYIVYIEMGQDDRQVLHAVPRDVAHTLQRIVYDRFTVRVLVPPHSTEGLTPIIPTTCEYTTVPTTTSTAITLSVIDTMSADTLLKDPPAGKTIILAAGRKRIEDIFTQYTESLEQQGVRLFCQGFGGGTSRLQAEFTACAEPGILVLSGFLYETIDLPPNTASTLLIESLPFDHPNHAIVSKRSEAYDNAFMDYSLPRMEYRMYRIMRTFASMCTAGAEVYITDARLTTKKYGEHTQAFLQRLFTRDQQSQSNITNPHNTNAPEGWQLELF